MKLRSKGENGDTVRKTEGAKKKKKAKDQKGNRTGILPA